VTYSSREFLLSSERLPSMVQELREPPAKRASGREHDDTLPSAGQRVVTSVVATSGSVGRFVPRSERLLRCSVSVSYVGHLTRG
jgi:hypothetical protein